MSFPRARVAPLLLSAGIAALAVAGAQLAVGAVRDLGRVPTDVDSAVAGLAGLALGAVLLVWCAGAAAAVAAAVTGTAGRAGAALQAVARATTPLLLRRLLAAALGAVVLGGVTGPALAGERSPATAPAAAGLTWPSATTAAPAPTASPSTVTPPATAGPATSTPTTAPTVSSSPGAARSAPPAPSSTAPSTARSSTPAGPSVGTARTAPVEVVVQRGDTLWSIAARHLPPGSTRAAVAAAWPRWYAANRTTIGADPDRLRPGQRLVAP